jgi:hypothetical protein
MLRISALVIILGGIALAHAADSVTIFGIHLGEPFIVPQCAESDPVTVASTCWTYEFPTESRDADMRSLHFANPPALGHDITAFVHDGMMDIVTIETAGIDTQDSVMSQLIEKFGKPVRFEKVPVQNRMGANFVVDRAEWSSPRYWVRFDADASDGGSHEGTLDKGWIQIETQKVHAENIKKEEQAFKARQPL